MFSINCAEPCLYRSVLKLIMLRLLPRPYTAYLERMAEQDIICTRYRNIYQCGHDRGKMFSINCAEPCLYRSLLKLIMLRLLPRPYTAYLARMAEQDIICTRFRNIYQCGHDRGKMFSINCAEPCLYRSVLKLIMLWLLPRPYTAYLARMAEQDIICTRYRNIYQCGS